MQHAQRSDKRFDVVPLVVRRDHHQRPAHRRRQPSPTPTSPSKANPYSSHGPTTMAGVDPCASGTAADNNAGRRNGAWDTTRPEESMMPEMPFVDGTKTQRPVSMARSREILNC